MKSTIFALILSLIAAPVLAINDRPATTPAGKTPFIRTEATHASITVREDDSRVLVGVFKPQGRPAKVRVTNARGKTVKLESVPRPHRSIRLDVDLRRLPDGAYDLTVEDHQGTSVQQMRVELHSVPEVGRRTVAVLFP